MNKRKAAVGLGLVVAVVSIARAAFAVSIGLSPSGGAPGTAYVATVECRDAPTLYAAPNYPTGGPATVVPSNGTETSPGVWTYNLTAGQFDDRIGVNCDEDLTTARFDVENPLMYLGPIGQPVGLPIDRLTDVEGTDCPDATGASVTFSGSGPSLTVTRPIDRYGDWSTPIPPGIAASDLVVTASCGSVHYEPLTIERRPSGATTSMTTGSVPAGDTPSVPSTPMSGSPPAVAVSGAVGLTG